MISDAKDKIMTNETWDADISYPWLDCKYNWFSRRFNFYSSNCHIHYYLEATFCNSLL